MSAVEDCAVWAFNIYILVSGLRLCLAAPVPDDEMRVVISGWSLRSTFRGRYRPLGDDYDLRAFLGLGNADLLRSLCARICQIEAEYREKTRSLRFSLWLLLISALAILFSIVFVLGRDTIGPNVVDSTVLATLAAWVLLVIRAPRPMDKEYYENVEAALEEIAPGFLERAVAMEYVVEKSCFFPSNGCDLICARFVCISRVNYGATSDKNARDLPDDTVLA